MSFKVVAVAVLLVAGVAAFVFRQFLTWQAIEAMSGLMTAGASVVAVWRYVFSLDLPVNLTAVETFTGGSGAINPSVIPHVFYYFSLSNIGEKDIQIAKIELQRKKWRYGFGWSVVHDQQLQFDQFPHRLRPQKTLDFPITIKTADLGTYRLCVREYGSWRYATLVLSELERAPKAPGA